ncbi:MAG TPA: GNAT family N-acetyltransferase [Chloroflexota bacterium]|nr:GNAT family N-acetyltransferase [Chloroflexota bacterium]
MRFPDGGRRTERVEPRSVVCTSIPIARARRHARIPSGFSTRQVYRLARKDGNSVLRWSLDEVELPAVLTKTYDSGDLDEWLKSYLQSVPEAALHFEAASSNGEIVGLLTWSLMEWNNTVWLIDIRTREPQRRRGIGSALIEELKALSRDLRVRGISVETQINNYPAVRFYRKHGFAISGFNDHLYANDDLARQDVALYLFWENC